MKKAVDYTEEYEKLLEMLMDRQPAPLSQREQEECDLVGKLTDVVLSQYQKIPDKKMQEKVEGKYFDFLNELARGCGGRVELDIHENTSIGILKFIAKDIAFTENKSVWGEFTELSSMIRDTDSFMISAEEDKFVLTFLFELAHSKKIIDRSEEIKEINEEMKRKRHETW